MFVVGALQSWPSFAALITETGSSVVYIRKNPPYVEKVKRLDLLEGVLGSVMRILRGQTQQQRVSQKVACFEPLLGASR
jgi:hypothetical protein